MYRKDSIIIEEWLKRSDKALLVTGARKKKNKHEKEKELGKKVSNNVSVCRLFCSFDYSLEFNGITSYSRKE